MSDLQFKNLPGSAALLGLVVANGASAATSIKLNLAAVVDPTVNDDSVAGYSVGSIWVNAPSSKIFQCANAAGGAAVWKEIASPITKQFVTQANAFSAGNVVRMSGATYVNAIASSQANAQAVGIIQSASGSDFTVVYNGLCTITAHGFTVGAALFLSTSVAALLTETEPTASGSISKLMAIVIDANTLLVINQRAVTVGVRGAGFTNTTLSNANVSLAPVTDPSYQRMTGILTGPVIVNISRTGAINGDIFEFALVNITATGVNTFTIRENGAGQLFQVSTANVINGTVKAIYDGGAGAWIIFSQETTLS